MRGWCLVIFLAALGLAPAALRAGENPAVVIRPAPEAWISQAMAPLYIDVRSPRSDGRLRVDLEFRSPEEYTISRETTLPAGMSSRLEFTVPADGYGRVVCRSGGWSEEREVFGQRFDNGSGFLRHGQTPPLICVNGFLFRELVGESERLRDREGESGLEVRSLALDELPARWQSYCGLSGVLVMEAREARALGPERREALARWVRWQGGRIWLAGPGADDAARELGLDGKSAEPGEGVIARRALTGWAWTQSSPDAGALVARLPKEPVTDPLHAYYRPGYDATPLYWLLDSLAGPSTNLIVVALVALGLAMGPLNYLYIRRRKKPILLFVTTPLIALAGTGAVFAASYLAEGRAGGYTQFAVLVRTGGGDATLYDARGVRSGFAAASPRFSAETLVLPIRRDGRERGRYALDLTDGTRLIGGWLRPRFATGFLTVTPVICRMDVKVEEEGGNHFAVNNLGFALRRLAVRLPDGGLAEAANVPPGGRVRLSSSQRGSMLGSSTLRDMWPLFGDGAPFRKYQVVAECEGLPYLDDGGLGAARLSGQFYYCRVDMDGAGDPE